ncbi:MAG TPA: integration host factor subunit alpha [Syntrophales bacterium]|nr:integration host factor subunit alpha [Syntrophales bacterium]
MTLTKADVIRSITEQIGYPKSRAEELLESTLEIIKQTLEDGEDIMISGFGKFNLIEKKARKGRNPQTGEPMIIAPRRVVSFKRSSRVKI